MALWKQPNYKIETENKTLGNGINVGVPSFDIDKTELTYVRNMGSQEYPAITTRFGRTFYSTDMTSLSTNLSGMGERANNQLHFIDGNTWKYWNSTASA